MELYEILVHPVISEKAVNLIESDNKITFKVNRKATKNDVKTAMEKIYNVKVASINMLNDTKGNKKAIIKLDAKFKASELSSKLGMV